MNKSVLALVAALVVGGVAACGDDDDSTESTTAALSDSQLVAEAEAICKEHNDAIAAGIKEEGVTGSPDEVETRTLVKDYVLPQYTAWIGRQDALEPPEDLASDWDTWIADSTAVRDAIKDDPSVAFDPSEFEAVNAEAESLGLGQDCAAGPTT